MICEVDSLVLLSRFLGTKLKSSGLCDSCVLSAELSHLPYLLILVFIFIFFSFLIFWVRVIGVYPRMAQNTLCGPGQLGTCVILLLLPPKCEIIGVYHYTQLKHVLVKLKLNQRLEVAYVLNICETLGFIPSAPKINQDRSHQMENNVFGGSQGRKGHCWQRQ